MNEQTQCKAGHPYTQLSTYLSPQGRRQCRLCRLNREEARRLERLVRELETV